MITKFETSATPSTGNGSKTLLIVLGVGIGIFLLYNYVLKPRMKAKEDAKK